MTIFNSYVCLPESRTLRNLSQTGIVGLCPKWSNIAISIFFEPSGGLCIAMFIMFEVFQSYSLLLHIIFRLKRPTSWFIARAGLLWSQIPFDPITLIKLLHLGSLLNAPRLGSKMPGFVLGFWCQGEDGNNHIFQLFLVEHSYLEAQFQWIQWIYWYIYAIYIYIYIILYINTTIH